MDGPCTETLSVIIPAYNEETVLPATIRTLSDALSGIRDGGLISDYQIVFVNDGSGDATGKILSSAAEADPHILACGYERNRGKGCAVRTGVLASTGDYVLYTDSDLAYGTAVIAETVKKLRETGADFVIGSRAIHPDGYAGYTFPRKLASKAYLRFLALAAGFSHSDSQCGFKSMKGESGRRVFADCTTDGFAFDFELLLRAERMGMTVVELPVRIETHRESKIHLIRDSMKMLADIRKIKRSVSKTKSSS